MFQCAGCRQTSDALCSSPLQLQRGLHWEASQHIKDYSLFFFSFRFPCHRGTETTEQDTIVSPHVALKPQRRTRDDALNNAVWQITSAGTETRCSSKTDQRCKIHKNREACSVETDDLWVTVLPESFTSRCCSHLACQLTRWNALTRNTAFINTQEHVRQWRHAIMEVWQNWSRL